MKRLMLRIIVYSISVVELEDGEKVEESLIVKLTKPGFIHPVKIIRSTLSLMYAYPHVQQYLSN